MEKHEDYISCRIEGFMGYDRQIRVFLKLNPDYEKDCLEVYENAPLDYHGYFTYNLSIKSDLTCKDIVNIQRWLGETIRGNLIFEKKMPEDVLTLHMLVDDGVRGWEIIKNGRGNRVFVLNREDVKKFFVNVVKAWTDSGKLKLTNA